MSCPRTSRARRSRTPRGSTTAPSRYERLAFLGDVVLSLAVSTHLFPRFERYGAGRLTKVRAQAVSGASCARGRGGAGRAAAAARARARRRGRRSFAMLAASERVLASVCEAVIGAAYLAFGIERVAPAVVAAFEEEIEEALENPVDYKSLLQERLAQRAEVVAYRIDSEEGPAHARSFVAVAEVGRPRDRPGRGPDQEGRRAGGGLAARALEDGGGRLMHLRSISMKGFKSFPHRTKLEFSPGVGVVVGPNGSGKSNITDAVLWALGEQSPLAVRGQTMKDVIFAGGHGVKGSSAAEVEVVIDNGDGGLESEFSEISIVRRLDRDGEGEYRLNGARCRLADVVEVLSDTGLGKEMHSVVSQGRVEAIVLSRPRDRRLLIEEAAGLGKHRKRRRRAQLKLERTEENLSRALDVEREARSRLRPLKRQAEAAELHERLQRQSDEARYELARDPVARGARALAQAEAEAAAASGRAQADACWPRWPARAEAGGGLRGALPRARGAAGRLFAARSAAERIGIRLERARDQARAAAEGAERRRSQLRAAGGRAGEAGDPAAAPASASPRWRRSWPRWTASATSGCGTAGRAGGRARGAPRPRAPSWREAARALRARRSRRPRRPPRRSAAERREAERAAEAARAAAARAGAELAAVNQFLRTAGSAGRRRRRCRSRWTWSPATRPRWPPRSARAWRPGWWTAWRAAAGAGRAGEDGGAGDGRRAGGQAPRRVRRPAAAPSGCSTACTPVGRRRRRGRAAARRRLGGGVARRRARALRRRRP